MERQYATFYAGNNLFGIDVLMVREINRNHDITPVDLAPDDVRGLLNLRGQIVTVVDLAHRLGIGSATQSATTRCIVMKRPEELPQHLKEKMQQHGSQNDIIGFLVDRIGDMVTINDGAIEKSPANVQEVDTRFIDGVVKLEGTLLILLKTQEVLFVEQAVAG